MMARRYKMETDAGTEYSVRSDILISKHPEPRVLVVVRKADGGNVVDSMTACEAEMLAHYLQCAANGARKMVP